MIRLIALLLLTLGMTAISGCSDSTGPGGADTLDDYWIEGYYCYYPPDVRELTWRSCVVYVRSGGASGEAVPGLSVTCNGQLLSFAQPSYSADIAGIEPGEDVTFELSDGRSSIALTLEVPGSPTDLALVEGEWDFSPPVGTHTLTWSNPGSVADSMLVAVGGAQGHPPFSVYAYSVQLPAEATQVTLSNADMIDFSGADVVSCSISQGVRGVFAGHSGGSEMWARAAVVGDWTR